MLDMTSDSEKTEALVQLAGTVAHELNNIFTAVTGNLSLLEKGFEKADANAKVVDDVIRTAHRGIELSRKLQAFAGRQPFRRVKVDLNQTIVDVLTDLKRSVLRSVDVHLELTQSPCLISADEDLCRWVLEELAKNATTAMDHRGWMTVSTAIVMLQDGEIPNLPKGAYAKLSIRDSGRGMSPQMVSRALDPFFSAKSGTDKGWGLARCAGFARQCGGRIVLTSTLGRGTAVELYLPQLPGTQAAPGRP